MGRRPAGGRGARQRREGRPLLLEPERRSTQTSWFVAPSLLLSAKGFSDQLAVDFQVADDGVILDEFQLFLFWGLPFDQSANISQFVGPVADGDLASRWHSDKVSQLCSAKVSHRL